MSKKIKILFSLFLFVLSIALIQGFNLKKINFIYDKQMNACQLTESISNNENTTITKEKINSNLLQEKINSDNMSISVIGNANKNFTPDKAKINASIETLNLDIKKSKDENLERLNKLKNVFKESNLGQITIESYTSYPSYDYSAGKTLIGYYTITNFSFEISSIDKIKDYIDILTENNVTSIHGINYMLTNQNEAYLEVLNEAIENAKTKAMAILGREPERIISIKEENVYSVCCLAKNFSENYDDDLIGKINISAKVNILFE